MVVAFATHLPHGSGYRTSLPLRGTVYIGHRSDTIVKLYRGWDRWGSAACHSDTRPTPVHTPQQAVYHTDGTGDHIGQEGFLIYALVYRGLLCPSGRLLNESSQCLCLVIAATTYAATVAQRACGGPLVLCKSRTRPSVVCHIEPCPPNNISARTAGTSTSRKDVTLVTTIFPQPCRNRRAI